MYKKNINVVQITGNLHDVELCDVSIRYVRIIFIALANHKQPYINIMLNTNKNKTDDYDSNDNIKMTCGTVAPALS